MLTPSLPFKNNMLTSSASGQCPQENKNVLWVLFLSLPQSLVRRGQGVGAAAVCLLLCPSQRSPLVVSGVPGPLLHAHGESAAVPVDGEVICCSFSLGSVSLDHSETADD